MDLGTLSTVLFILFEPALTQNDTNEQTHNSTSDPFLKYQPHFARSLPVQVLLIGIVLTLTVTLLIHLCFTWQYHWPLARINWILQFTGACMLLVNVIAYLYVTLIALSNKSKNWPYMFEYVAIEIPSLSYWTIPEIVAWYTMEAATTAVVAITHIQFLTFLYPSRLEARLVFLLLGPLALVSSIMTLLPIATYAPAQNNDPSTNHTIDSFLSPNDTTERNSTSMYKSNPKLYDLFDAIRNICNLTLSFLFTLSLLIWGLFVNRESAWRTDGGTAAFGVGALLLTVVTTALNFLKVTSRSPLEWLPPLLCAVILWQSFLGWWWWVGSASGIASRELDNEKRRRKEKKKARQKKRQIAALSHEDEAISSRLDRWRSSVGVTISRRKPTTSPGQDDARSQRYSPPESIELRTISSLRSSADEDTSSSHIVTSKSPFTSVQRAWRALRHAHTDAARIQAIEQRQIQLQIRGTNGPRFGRFTGSLEDGSDGERSTSENGPERLERGASSKKQKSGGWFLVEAVRRWRLRDSTTY